MKVLITQPNGKEKLVAAFHDTGADLIRTHNYDKADLIVPVVDEELPALAYLKPHLLAVGTTIAISSEYSICMTRDKAEFYRFCRRHDFDTPATMQEKVIVKPRFGKGSKGMFVADRSYIVQSFIDWPEYSIDYFKYDDALSVIPRLRQNVVNGESNAGVAFMDERLIKEATRLGAELNLEFHNVMQCFYDGEHIKWIEVNCRYGGGSWLTFDKFNSPKFLVERLG